MDKRLAAAKTGIMDQAENIGSRHRIKRSVVSRGGYRGIGIGGIARLRMAADLAYGQIGGWW